MLSSGGFSIYNFFIFKGYMGSTYKRIKKLNASILNVLRDSIFPSNQHIRQKKKKIRKKAQFCPILSPASCGSSVADKYWAQGQKQGS